MNFTDSQLLFISGLLSGVIAAVLSYFTSRQTVQPSVTKEAFNGLVQTIATLRNEVNAEKDSRLEDAARYEKIIEQEKVERKRDNERHNAELKELEKRLTSQFERERVKYQGYIKELVIRLDSAKIDYPEWNTSD